MPRFSMIAALRFSVALLLLLCISSCDLFHTGFDDIENAEYFQAARMIEAPGQIDTLKVMCWNIKFGGARLAFFWECNGSRYLMTEDEVMRNMSPIAEKICQVNPDLLLIQEIDVCSKRTAYVDQMQYLLDHTDLNWGVYGSSWRADYVPSDGIGRIDTGIAILSRWRLRDAERIALPLIDEQSAIERYFYLRRCILRARIDLPEQAGFYVVNVHTAAFAEDDTKKKHIDRFKEELDRIDIMETMFIAGGDLNAIPPGSPLWKDFPDEEGCSEGRFEGDDYTGEEDWLEELYDAYTPAIPLADYQNDPDSFFSFTGNGNGFWNRKLDYIFTNGEIVPGSGAVHQDTLTGMATLPLSDHAPVVVLIEAPQ